MDAKKLNNLDTLDKLDELIHHFRPIEQLFRVMGAADPSEDGELARSCAEIGLCLTVNFRECLDRLFRIGADGGGGGNDNEKR